MKTFLLVMLFFFSFFILTPANELCDDLDCVDKNFMIQHYEKYSDIFQRTLKDAKNCKDREKVKKILEFSKIVRGHISSEEGISYFIEHEFINNPVCILSLMKEISPSARKEVSRYLAFSTYIHWKEIDAVLHKYKKDFPKEVNLILTGKDND